MTDPTSEMSWIDGKSGIKTYLKDMSVDQLKDIKHDLQRRYVSLFNRMNNIDKWVERIDEEAERRDCEIHDLKVEVLSNNKILKNAYKQDNL